MANMFDDEAAEVNQAQGQAFDDSVVHATFGSTVFGSGGATIRRDVGARPRVKFHE